MKLARPTSCLSSIHSIKVDSPERSLILRIRSKRYQQKGLGKYCHLEKPKVQDEGVLLELQSGSNGENISILDPGLDSIVGEFDSEKAPMVRSRVYLRNPVGKYSILCVEHVKGSAGDTFLKTPFKNWLKAAVPGCLLDWEPVAEEESLDAFKSIEDFEVRKYLRPSDMADSLITGANYISYKLAHKKAALSNRST